jgi:hypothetical protein
MIDIKLLLTVKPDPVGHKTEGHYIVNAGGEEAAWPKGKGRRKGGRSFSACGTCPFQGLV